MAGIRCEICGGANLIKEDNMFVCQRCKTKYTVEDARKLFFEDFDDKCADSVIDIRETVSEMEEQLSRDMSLTADSGSKDETFDIEQDSPDADTQEAVELETDIVQEELECSSEQVQQEVLPLSEIDQGERGAAVSSKEDEDDLLILEDQSMPVSEEPESVYCAICHKSGCVGKDIILYDSQTPLCLECNLKIKYAKQSDIDKKAQVDFFIQQVEDNNVSDEGMILLSSIYENYANDLKLVESGIKNIKGNSEAEGHREENGSKVKKPLCVWSVVALVVSIAAFGAYCLVLGPKIRAFIPVWEVLGVVSIFVPAVAKHFRLAKDQSGRWMEIAAIVIGGFAFAEVIFLLTDWSMYFSYLGWIVGGLIYKAVKQ